MPIKSTTVLTLLSSANAWLIGPSRPEGGDDRGQAQQHGHQRPDEGPERDQKDEQGHGQREHLGPVEVAIGG
jgi:hypothetical protein